MQRQAYDDPGGAASREQARIADQRISDLSLERQTVDGQISALALKIETQKGLVQEAAVYTGLAVPGSGAGALPLVPTYDLVVDPRPSAGAPNGRLYLGTDTGAYESLDGGATWAILGRDLPALYGSTRTSASGRATRVAVVTPASGPSIGFELPDPTM